MEEATAQRAMKTIMPPPLLLLRPFPRLFARPPLSLARCTASPSHTIPSKVRHGHQHTHTIPSFQQEPEFPVRHMTRIAPTIVRVKPNLHWTFVSSSRVCVDDMMSKKRYGNREVLCWELHPLPFFLGAFPVQVLPQDASRHNPTLSKISSSQMAKCLRCS